MVAILGRSSQRGATTVRRRAANRRAMRGRCAGASPAGKRGRPGQRTRSTTKSVSWRPAPSTGGVPPWSMGCEHAACALRDLPDSDVGVSVVERAGGVAHQQRHKGDGAHGRVVDPREVLREALHRLGGLEHPRSIDRGRRPPRSLRAAGCVDRRGQGACHLVARPGACELLGAKRELGRARRRTPSARRQSS